MSGPLFGPIYQQLFLKLMVYTYVGLEPLASIRFEDLSSSSRVAMTNDEAIVSNEAILTLDVIVPLNADGDSLLRKSTNHGFQ